MILHYFKNKENKDKKIANFLYLKTILSSKKIIDNDLFNKDKAFDVTFEISSILLITIFIGSKSKINNDWININQELLNIFIKDLDHSMRLSGISDMNIGKYVKSYTKKFFFRIKKVEEIYQSKDFNLFTEYISKLQILNSNNNTYILQNIFLDLKTLLKRSQFLKNKKLLFNDLFK